MTAPYSGAIRCVARTITDGGFSSLWRGQLVVLYQSVIPIFMRWSGLSARLRGLYTTPPNHFLQFLKSTIDGAVTYPLDYAHTQLVCDASHRFTGVADVLQKTAASDGFLAIYRGMGVSVLGVVLYRAIYFALYDTLHPRLRRSGTFGKIALSLAITQTASFAAYPIDTIRRRMMVSLCTPFAYTSASQCLRATVSRDGFLSLFDGAVANLVRGLGAVLAVSALDALTQSYTRWQYPPPPPPAPQYSYEEQQTQQLQPKVYDSSGLDEKAQEQRDPVDQKSGDSNPPRSKGSSHEPKMRQLLVFVLGCVVLSVLVYSSLDIRSQPIPTRQQQTAPPPTCPQPTAPPRSWFSVLQEKLKILNTDTEMDLFEVLVTAELPTTPGPHSISHRFPLPETPMIFEMRNGSCLFRDDICQLARTGSSKFNPDAHIRDLMHSMFLKCSLPVWKKGDCLALDIGANFGLHSIAMLTLGAHVIALEPQYDLCLAMRVSIAAHGYADKASIMCGGVARNTTADRLPIFHWLQPGQPAMMWRYGGMGPPYKMPSSVPLYPVATIIEQIPRDKRHFNFIKIDTDSIDCFVLNQVVDLMDNESLTVDSLVLESWDSSCQGNALIGKLLGRLARKGYFIYRTHVTERSWDDNNHESGTNWKPVPGQPPEFVEQFSQRFNLVLWKANQSIQDDGTWIKLSVGRIWQFFITKDELVSMGYVTAHQ